MVFLEITLEILSPTVIAERRSLRGFLKVLDYIPASTLRGAILSELYRVGVIKEDFLEDERRNPSVIASYAYPLIDGGEKSYPGHPFMYKCKICGESENHLADVIEELESNGELRGVKHITCKKGHTTLESLYSKPYFNGKDQKVRRIPTSRFISTSVSKERGSSETGMLYEYEAITPGRRFWTTLAIPDKIGEYVDGLEIHIGRGISRGFGRSKIVNSKVINLKDVEMKIGGSITDGKYLVLYASSPMVSCSGGVYTPYPLEIDVSGIKTTPEVCEEGRLKIKAVYGRADFHIGGWDMYRNVEKPTVKFATRPGAIVTAEFNGSPSALAFLSLLGTIERLGDTVITGVNMLHPVRAHPIFTLGGG